jgi:hypothetical protein
MDHPEMTPGAEPASNEELQNLYELAEGWLLAHGANSHSLGSRLFGSEDGVDIADEQPMFSYLITEHEAKAISPEAVEILHISGNFEMSFAHECYIRKSEDPDDLQYEAPIAMFHIDRNKDDQISHTTFSIEIDENGAPVSYRTEEERDRPKGLQPGSLDQAVEGLADRYQLEHELGYNNLTKDEIQALRTLLEGVIANPPVPPPAG